MGLKESIQKTVDGWFYGTKPGKVVFFAVKYLGDPEEFVDKMRNDMKKNPLLYRFSRDPIGESIHSERPPERGTIDEGARIEAMVASVDDTKNEGLVTKVEDNIKKYKDVSEFGVLEGSHPLYTIYDFMDDCIRIIGGEIIGSEFKDKEKAKMLLRNIPHKLPSRFLFLSKDKKNDLLDEIEKYSAYNFKSSFINAVFETLNKSFEGGGRREIYERVINNLLLVVINDDIKEFNHLKYTFAYMRSAEEGHGVYEVITTWPDTVKPFVKELDRLRKKYIVNETNPKKVLILGEIKSFVRREVLIDLGDEDVLNLYGGIYDKTKDL